MTSESEIFDALERIAVKDYGARFSIVRFSSNWRPSDREFSGKAAAKWGHRQLTAPLESRRALLWGSKMRDRQMPRKETKPGKKAVTKTAPAAMLVNDTGKGLEDRSGRQQC